MEGGDWGGPTERAGLQSPRPPPGDCGDFRSGLVDLEKEVYENIYLICIQI